MVKSNMIGNKITEARKKMSLSQAQLAELLFISPQAVGKWERGESMPDIITFNRLAEILGVDLNYFSESFQTVTTEVITIEKQATESPSGEQKKKHIWDMSQANLVDTDFSGLKNLHEKFSSSNMQNCLFIGSEMSGLLLKGNNIDRCNFSGSDISNSHFQRSNLGNNVFKDCLLLETEFSGNNISGCDFTGANFTGASFKYGNLEKSNISNAVWDRTSFIGMNIDNMVFEGKFEDCYFENCAFYRVTFQNSTLSNTFFKNNKKMKSILFIDCKVDKMTYAFLKTGKADLSGITLLAE